MRPLNSPCPAHALATLEPVRKQTKEARGFRRAQAVRAVVVGHHVTAASETFHLPNAARSKWVQRFATEGAQGLRARPRPGRPRPVTCALAPPRHRLVEPDPLAYGACSSQGSCRARATGLAHHSGSQRGRERGRLACKQTREAPAALPASALPTPLTWPRPIAHAPPWSPGRVRARASGSMQRQPWSGALPCPDGAGGGVPSALACPHAL
jgi:Helix-turn-helix domain